MGALWKIAIRNTARHKRRTIITAVVMMAGIGTFITFDSMISGMDRMAIDNMADYTLSSIKVRDPAYVDDLEANPLDKPLADPAGVTRALADEGLASAPRVRFVARASNYADEIPVLATAVDPAADARVLKIAASVASGTWLAGAPPKSVVIGSGLAAELALEVGDPVLVSAQTASDTTNADEYAIVGIVDAPAPEVNRGGLFMSLADARELLVAPKDFVTEIDAALPRATTLNATLAAGDRVAQRLRDSLPGVRVDAMRVLAKEYLALRDAKSKNSFILVLVVLLISAVGIVNTILMSVYSRIREIGVLRAYGMPPKDVARLFTLEGAAIGLVGSALGVALGAALELFMVLKGISFEAFAGIMGSLPFSGYLKGEWNPATMAVGFAFGVAVSLIAARIPARRAAKLEPTAALRFQ